MHKDGEAFSTYILHAVRIARFMARDVFIALTQGKRLIRATILQPLAP
jgi:hypothetical protein